MKKAWLAVGFLAFVLPVWGQQRPTVVGVSWANFQEERWRRDEAAIKEQLARMGAQYVSTDAQSSAEKQLNDIDSLIARGVNASSSSLGTRTPSCLRCRKRGRRGSLWWPTTA